MYALGGLVGPLISTAIATAEEDREEGWRMVYYVTLGTSALNLIAVALAFRDTLFLMKSQSVEAQREERRNKEALEEVGQLLKLKNVWLMSAFYFFQSGAWSTSGGMNLLPLNQLSSSIHPPSTSTSSYTTNQLTQSTQAGSSNTSPNTATANSPK